MLILKITYDKITLYWLDKESYVFLGNSIFMQLSPFLGHFIDFWGLF